MDVSYSFCQPENFVGLNNPLVDRPIKISNVDIVTIGNKTTGSIYKDVNKPLVSPIY